MRHLLSYSLMLLVLLSATQASGYVRTKTCDPDGEDVRRLCKKGYVPVEIWWPKRCVTIFLNRQGGGDFEQEEKNLPSFELREAVGAAMVPWNDVSCSDVTLTYGGLTCNRQVVKRQDNVRNGFMNTVLWQEEEWTGGTGVVALARVSFDAKDGRISDVDIEMNGVDNTFGILQSADESNPKYDVENTLVHEFGHLLGLAHETQEEDATMWASADNGELKKRDLHPDDEAGLCAIYPSDDSTPACFPAVLEDTTCVVEFSGQAGCAHTPGAPDAPPAWWLALGAIGWIGRRRRLLKAQ